MMTVNLLKRLLKRVQPIYGYAEMQREQRKDEQTSAENWRVLRVLASVLCDRIQQRKYVFNPLDRGELQKIEMTAENTRQHSQHSQDTIVTSLQTGLQSGSNYEVALNKEGELKREHSHTTL